MIRTYSSKPPHPNFIRSDARRKELSPVVVPCQSAPKTSSTILLLLPPHSPDRVLQAGEKPSSLPYEASWFRWRPHHRLNSKSWCVFLSLLSKSALSEFIRSTAGFTGTCTISKVSAFLLWWQPTLSLRNLKDLQIQSVVMTSLFFPPFLFNGFY